jgi:iron-sulfur cluster insertion protein
VFEHGEIAVVVDDVSLDLLNGAELDFVEDLMGASFQIKNPNAASSCGCGNSFSI